MMNKPPIRNIFLKTLCVFGFWLAASNLNAQDQGLGTESVTVVKAYAPVVLVGAKPIVAPLLSDLKLAERMAMRYHIMTFPVAATFMPLLGEAEPLAIETPPKSFNSMAQIGLGMRGTADVLFDSRIKKSRYKSVGINLDHHSMSRNLPKLNWDSNFFNTSLIGSYTYQKRDSRFETDLTLRHLAYSWYGLPTSFNTNSKVNNDLEGLSILSLAETEYNLQQNYFSAALGTAFTKEKGVFKKAQLNAGYFRDLTESYEQKAALQTDFEFPLGNIPLKLEVGAAYLSGDFMTNELSSFESTQGDPYSYYKFHVAPQLMLTSEKAYLKMGARIIYANAAFKEAGKLKVYPDLHGHYSLVEQSVLIFGSMSGDYIINSFEGFVNENPFVSPSLSMRPTDLRYSLRLGVKGLLGSFSYAAYWAQQSMNDRALFVENPVNYFRTFPKAFNLGNSFEVVYEAMDQNTLGISLDWEPLSGMLLRGQYETHSFALNTQEGAWHLPEQTAKISVNYSFLKDFSLQINWEYTGERAARNSQVVQFITAGEMPSYTYDLPAYNLVGLHFNYQINEKLSLFLKGTNLTDSAYEIWSGFAAPPRIVLAGAQYKFDF
jgi:hypothetical protein